MRSILLVQVLLLSFLGAAQAFPSENPVHPTVNTLAFAVSGTVTDLKGEPLVGASIVEKGTTTGAITDIDGKFQFNVSSEKATLVVSFVGYNSLNVAINGQSSLKIELSEGSALNEISVVGYGTQKKSQTTGAISSLNSRQLTEMPVTNVAQALQGRVAGVDVAQSGSKPGSVPTIRVRGRRSFRASNDPLYVVDGVPLAGTPAFVNTPGYGGVGGIADATTGFEDLNPNDVQSMEI